VSALTRTKIALALIGLVLFGAGVRLERTELRWIGLGFVLVAWMMRFAGPREGRRSETEPE
jgi:hypothetical protein